MSSATDQGPRPARASIARTAWSAARAGGVLGAGCAIAEAAWLLAHRPEGIDLGDARVCLALTFCYYSIYGVVGGLVCGSAAGLVQSALRRLVPKSVWHGLWAVVAVIMLTLFGRWLDLLIKVPIEDWPAVGLILLAVVGIALAGAVFAVASWLGSRRLPAGGYVKRFVIGVWMLALAAGLGIGYWVRSPAPEVWWTTRRVKRMGSSSRPNVLLVVMDTLRADYLGCYGHRPNATPNLDAFAADSTLFSDVVSPGSWTLPAHASLFTGLAVSQHGVCWTKKWLPDECLTLAEALSRTGYQTTAISSNPIFENRNFDQGFDDWLTVDGGRRTLLGPAVLGWLQRRAVRHLGLAAGLGVLPQIETDKGAVALTQALMRWFRNSYDPNRPFFIYLNYFETHLPYEPPLRWRREVLGGGGDLNASYDLEQDIQRVVFPYNAGLTDLTDRQLALWRRLYEAEVRYLDDQIEYLLRFLGDTGLLDRTLVILTSDHGDHLGEQHMVHHLRGVYQPLIRVPLMIRWPPVFPPGRRVDRMVQTSDLFGTVLRACGIDLQRSTEMNWRDLSQWPAPHDWPDLALAETLQQRTANRTELDGWPGAGDAAQRPLQTARAIRQGPWKYIANQATGEELYDLSADPLEQKSLAASQPAVTARLRRRLAERLAELLRHRIVNTGPPGPPEHSRQQLRRLRDLGYVE